MPRVFVQSTSTFFVSFRRIAFRLRAPNSGFCCGFLFFHSDCAQLFFLLSLATVIDSVDCFALVTALLFLRPASLLACRRLPLLLPCSAHLLRSHHRNRHPPRQRTTTEGDAHATAKEGVWKTRKKKR